MKTTLNEQRVIVELIRKGATVPGGILKLREWLKLHGYEEITDCSHYTINRVNGKCTSCGIQYCEPIIIDRPSHV